MAAPKGNKFWLARSSHGRDPIFKSPDALWSAAVEYFEWVEDNPLYEAKVAANKGEPDIVDVRKMRAMSIDGLQNFLNISHPTWLNYAKRDDFITICAQIAKIIRQQKFEGASAGLLNHAIIARDLGLTDKQDITSNGETIGATKESLIEQATRLGVDPALLGLIGSAQEGNDA